MSKERISDWNKKIENVATNSDNRWILVMNLNRVIFDVTWNPIGKNELDHFFCFYVHYLLFFINLRLLNNQILYYSKSSKTPSCHFRLLTLLTTITDDILTNSNFTDWANKLLTDLSAWQHFPSCQFYLKTQNEHVHNFVCFLFFDLYMKKSCEFVVICCDT